MKSGREKEKEKNTRTRVMCEIWSRAHLDRMARRSSNTCTKSMSIG